MTRAGSPRAILWLMLAAALFMRAVLPAGIMPERTATGAIAVKLCESGGLWLIPLKQEAPKDEHRDQAPCAFAGLASPAAPPPAIADLAPVDPAEPAFVALAAEAEAFAAQPVRPPTRGPPLPA